MTAAVIAPTPTMPVMVLPVAATACPIRVSRGDLAVQDHHVVDQDSGDLPTGPPGDIAGTHRGQQGFRATAVRSLCAPAGISSINTWCSRLTACVRDRTWSRRRADSSRNATI
jgi:hypothetical protein